MRLLELHEVLQRHDDSWKFQQTGMFIWCWLSCCVKRLDRAAFVFAVTDSKAGRRMPVENHQVPNQSETAGLTSIEEQFSIDSFADPCSRPGRDFLEPLERFIDKRQCIAAVFVFVACLMKSSFWLNSLPRSDSASYQFVGAGFRLRGDIQTEANCVRS